MKNLSNILKMGAIALPLVFSGCKYQFTVPTKRDVKTERVVVDYMRNLAAVNMLPYGIAKNNIAIGIALSHPAQFHIRFKGKQHSFESAKREIYRKFSRVGEEAVVSYEETNYGVYERDGNWYEAFSSWPIIDSKASRINTIAQYNVIDADPIRGTKK